MKIVLFTTHKSDDQLSTRRMSEFLNTHHLEFRMTFVDDYIESLTELKTLCFGKVSTPALYREGEKILLNPADYKLAQVFKIQSVIDTFDLEMGGRKSIDLIDMCDN